MLSIAPFRGREAEVATVLGAELPAPGADRRAGGRTADLGRHRAVAAARPGGGAARSALAGPAAVTDQSDGWAALRWTAPAPREVLARLVPIDLDPAAFPPGRVARTPAAGHTPACSCRTAAGFEILVMRSFTRTAAHELAARCAPGRRAGR